MFLTNLFDPILIYFDLKHDGCRQWWSQCHCLGDPMTIEQFKMEVENELRNEPFGHKVNRFIRINYERARSCWWAVKHAWQRVVRGYDNRIYWSIPYYLAPMISQVCKDMAANCISHPNELAPDEWKSILGKIAHSMDLYLQQEEIVYDPAKEEAIKGGFELFGKWFSHLWD